MSTKAPLFQNANTCFKCNAKFGMLRRKHHCRNCGNTCCDKCSQWSNSIPHYGYNDPVRTCEECNKKLNAMAKSNNQKESRRAQERDAAIAAAVEAVEEPEKAAAPKKVINCVCNMPLCICEPEPEPEPEPEEQKEAEKPKEKPKPKKKAAKPSKPSTFGGFGGFGSSQKRTYNLKGDLNEQCREAIKHKDDAGVKTLLGAKCNPNYRDRTGNSLVHLAAMFDRFSTVKILVEAGANIWATNESKETAVDLAPPSLGRKMKELQPKKE